MGKRFHYAYAIVASCIAITCLPCALVLSCAGIFFTPVSEYFGVARAQFTLYFSILNIMMMVTLPLAGNHLSRLSVRRVLSGATLLSGLGLIGMSQGGSMEAMMGVDGFLLGDFAVEAFEQGVQIAGGFLRQLPYTVRREKPPVQCILSLLFGVDGMGSLITFPLNLS